MFKKCTVVLSTIVVLVVFSACETIPATDQQARDELTLIKEELAQKDQKIADLESAYAKSLKALEELNNAYAESKVFLEELRSIGDYPNSVVAVTSLLTTLQSIEDMSKEMEAKANRISVISSDHIRELTSEKNMLLAELNRVAEDSQTVLNTLIIGFDQSMNEKITNTETEFDIRLSGLEKSMADYQRNLSLKQETEIVGLNAELEIVKKTLETTILGYVSKLEDLEEQAALIPGLQTDIRVMKFALRSAGESVKEAGEYLEDVGAER